MHERVCNLCGKRYIPKTDKQKFCSQKCNKKASRVRCYMKIYEVESFEDALEMMTGGKLEQPKTKFTRKCRVCGRPCLGFRCDACMSAAGDNYLDYY